MKGPLRSISTRAVVAAGSSYCLTDRPGGRCSYGSHQVPDVLGLADPEGNTLLPASGVAVVLLHTRGPAARAEVVESHE